MKQNQKFWAVETSGPISTRKVPRWNVGRTDIQEYLAMLNDDWDVPGGDM